MGDFNFPSIDWSMQSANGTDITFLDLIDDLYVFQHVTFPTREHNSLDLVITSDPSMVSHIQSIGALGSSDHESILCNVHAKIFVCGDNKQIVPEVLQKGRL